MDLTDTHQALSDAVRGLLTAHAADAALWPRLCKEIGVAGLAVPETYGGSGATLLESCVVLNEVGRLLTPAPMLGSVLVTEALLRTGDPDACDRLLPTLCAGDRIATLAWSGDLDRADFAVTGEGRLSGEASQVLDAEAADVLIVPAADALWEVAATAPGVAVSPSDVLDPTRPLAVVRLDGAAGRRLGGDAGLLPSLRDLACVALSAEQVGAASRAFEATHEYVQQRVQFGRTIGSFQVLQHRLAEAYLLLEAATTASWTAAEALVAGAGDAPLLAAAAKVYCSDALRAIAGEMVQMHGGIAITWEHDAHRYLRRAYADTELFGAPARHTERLAATLLAQPFNVAG